MRNKAKATLVFLKEALKKITPDLLFRGSRNLVVGDKKYKFEMLEGTIENGLWGEKITEAGKIIFTQAGIAGIVADRNQNKQPVDPWSR